MCMKPSATSPRQAFGRIPPLTAPTTRSPPSQVVNLPPRRGKLLPWVSPPLSAVKIMIVESHRPVLLSVPVMLPTRSSSAGMLHSSQSIIAFQVSRWWHSAPETIAWMSCASLLFTPLGASGYNARYFIRRLQRPCGCSARRHTQRRTAQRCYRRRARQSDGLRPRQWCARPPRLNAIFIIFIAEFIILNAKFIISNTGSAPYMNVLSATATHSVS